MARHIPSCALAWIELLPKEITLLHGPGCPVCVTAIELIDKAIAIAQRPDVIFCSFGDMLRVPGSTRDLLSVKSRGRRRAHRVQPAGCAQDGPEHTLKSRSSSLPSGSRPPRRQMPWPSTRPRGWASPTSRSWSRMCWSLRPWKPPLSAVPACAGVPGRGACLHHGYTEYEPIAKQYHVPIVVTGFEPVDILQGVYLCVKQLEEGRAEVENAYSRCVRPRRQPGGAAPYPGGLLRRASQVARHGRDPQ